MPSVASKSWISGEIGYRTILHIDDEWAHALIVEVRPESTLIIGAAKERRIEIGPQIRASSLASVCEDALRRAEDMTKQTIGQIVVPDEALLSIRGPHLCCVACTAQVKRPEPDRPISQREVKRLLARLYRSAESQAANGSGAGKERTFLELLQAEVVDARVDGLAVTTPIRFRGETLDASALLLFGHSSVVEELRSLATVLKLDAQLVAVPWAVANLRPHPNAIGLLLDAHETSLFRMKGNQIIALEACEHGGQELESDLAVSLGLPRFRAAAIREAYLDGELDEEGDAILETAVRYSIRRWLQDMQAPLGKLAEQGALPAHLLYWEATLAWPGMEAGLLAWMEEWGLDVFPSVQRLSVADVPSVGDRTGTIHDTPSATILCALANHAGQAHLARHPMSDMLHHIAIG